MESVERFLAAPEQSALLLGPRGTGKSTWTRATLPNAFVVDLLEPALYRSLLARPERLNEMLDGNREADVVVIDEVQRVPELLSVVHARLESSARQRFVLTGSSARKLRREGVNLLAGRALSLTMHPFMAAELGRDFNLSAALQLGLLPVVLGAEKPSATLRSYVSLYVVQEVQAEGLVRRIDWFARFLEAASFSHGTVLNISAIARECEIKRKTTESYLNILEDLLLAYRVPVFTRRAKRAAITKPKLYFFDAGVFRSLRPTGPLDNPAEIDGAALEGLVAQHLRAWIDYTNLGDRLHFWRTPAGTEVDFVVYGPSGFWAIEVKNTDRIRPADLRGLRAFASDYPEAQTALAYRGRERLVRDGIQCLPIAELLTALTPGKPLWPTGP